MINKDNEAQILFTIYTQFVLHRQRIFFTDRKRDLYTPTVKISNYSKQIDIVSSTFQ